MRIGFIWISGGQGAAHHSEYGWIVVDCGGDPEEKGIKLRERRS
jgi:hypothetical protein